MNTRLLILLLFFFLLISCIKSSAEIIENQNESIIKVDDTILSANIPYQPTVESLKSKAKEALKFCQDENMNLIWESTPGKRDFLSGILNRVKLHSDF